jgi:hypothetical protein
MTDLSLTVEGCSDEGPQSALERKLIVEYLTNKGYSLEQLKSLPKDEAHDLMREACQYASLKIAEVEAKAAFRKKIVLPE